MFIQLTLQTYLLIFFFPTSLLSALLQKLPPCVRGRGRGAADGSRTGRSMGRPPAESATTSGVQTTLPAAAAASNRGLKNSKTKEKNDAAMTVDLLPASVPTGKRQTTRTTAPAAKRKSRNRNPRLRQKRSAVGKSSSKGTSSETAGEDSKVLTFDTKMQNKGNHMSNSAQEPDGDAED